MKNVSQAAVLLAALSGVLAGSGFALPKQSLPMRRAAPRKSPEQNEAEAKLDAERREWNAMRDQVYRSKRAGKYRHWSANCHIEAKTQPIPA